MHNNFCCNGFALISQNHPLFEMQFSQLISIVFFYINNYKKHMITNKWFKKTKDLLALKAKIGKKLIKKMMKKKKKMLDASQYKHKHFS